MMLELGRHAGFILASYAATVLILGGLLASSLVAYRRARRALTVSETPPHE